MGKIKRVERAFATSHPESEWTYLVTVDAEVAAESHAEAVRIVEERLTDDPN